MLFLDVPGSPTTPRPALARDFIAAADIAFPLSTQGRHTVRRLSGQSPAHRCPAYDAMGRVTASSHATPPTAASRRYSDTARNKTQKANANLPETDVAKAEAHVAGVSACAADSEERHSRVARPQRFRNRSLHRTLCRGSLTIAGRAAAAYQAVRNNGGGLRCPGTTGTVAAAKVPRDHPKVRDPRCEICGR